MPTFDDEPKLSRSRLLTVGLPSFIAAAVVSFLIHQYAHMSVLRASCGGATVRLSMLLSVEQVYTDCPIASLAGPVATFLLALISFAIYLRMPTNLFWGSMAFINASSRIPQTISVFFELLFRQRSDLPVDESAALKLLHMRDPAVSIVLLCFFMLTLLFLTIIIIHDTRMVRSKWLVAAGLFALLTPLESILLRVIIPMVA